MTHKNLRIEQLRTFVTVADEGNLTRAAERLYLSQPTLSGHLRRLEEQLGVPLLTRTASGMEMTGQGAILFGKAQEILRHIDDFCAQAQSLRCELHGVVRLGLIMLDPESLRLPRIIGLLNKKHPGVEVILKAQGPTQCYSDVLNNRLDGAFYANPVLTSEIATLPLTALRYAIIAPAQWGHQIQTKTLLSSLALLPWLRAPAPSAHYDMINQLFSKTSVKPQRFIEVDHESVIISLVKAGMGVSMLRHDLAKEAARAGEVIIWKNAPTLCMPLIFISQEKRKNNPLLSALLAAVSEAWEID